MRDAPSLALSVATTFGLGRLRPFPGTWGSLPPVVVAAALVGAGLGPASVAWLMPVLMAVVVVVFSWGCVAGADLAIARFGTKDPSQVVGDETAGMALALCALPASGFATPGLAALTLVYAFVAFRAFDVVKPWPAGAAQEIPGAWGILLDDLIAGVMALGLVWVVTSVTL